MASATVEQLGEQVLHSLEEITGCPLCDTNLYSEMIALIAVAIRNAISDEREACARICDQLDAKYESDPMQGVAADMIRARGRPIMPTVGEESIP